LWYLGSWDEISPFEISEKQIHCLCNAKLDTSWPKVETLKKKFAETIAKDLPKEELIEELFCNLQDQTVYPDEQLPQTGVGIEWERHLSSIFVGGDGILHGTRSQEVVLVDYENNVTVIERSMIIDSLQINKEWNSEIVHGSQKEISGPGKEKKSSTLWRETRVDFNCNNK
jgi:uncharacterized protein with NRDE domain